MSAIAYFHDLVMAQPPLAARLLPAGILGGVLVLLFVFNPLAGWLGNWSLRRDEVAVIAALGLVSCSLPETGFFRIALTNLAGPAYQYPTKANWQAHEAFAYVPGGPATLAEGHVQDWPALAQALLARGDQSPASVPGQLWRELPAQQRHALAQIADGERPTADLRRSLVRAINAALRHGTLHTGNDAGTYDLSPRGQRLLERAQAAPLDEQARLTLNRELLVAAMAGVVLPPPEGGGVLLMGGQRDPDVVEPLMQGGLEGGEAGSLMDLPWSAWWPVLRLWGGVVLLLGLATLCLALVLHPQWSHHELLPYPIARFVNEMCAREPGRLIPTVSRHAIFWWGFGIVFSLHLVNGLAVWLPDAFVPTIPTQLDFQPMIELFPGIHEVLGAPGYFAPVMFFSVIAFTFFLPAKVSFSMGVAPLLFAILGATMLRSGYLLENRYLSTGEGNMLRFGAYLGMACVIAYTGRQYYARVALGAIGLGAGGLPRSTVWAARGAVLCALAAVALLSTSGLHWSFAATAVILILLMFVVIARIAAETGMFTIQPYWMPVGVVTALMGFDALGPTTYILLALASTMIVGDTRSALMGHLVNVFQIVDRVEGKPVQVAPWMMVMIVSGFVVAGMASLYSAYYFDAFRGAEGFFRDMLPAMPFDELSQNLAEASALDQLAEITARGGWEHWLAIQPDMQLVAWMMLGVGLMAVCAAARLRWPWWPLHPVVFLVWGTYPATVFASSFLIGWAVKQTVLATRGAQGYRALVPLMVGVIAGELVINCVWLGVGTVYYLMTGMTPSSYSVF